MSNVNREGNMNYDVSYAVGRLGRHVHVHEAVGPRRPRVQGMAVCDLQ